MRYVRAVLRYGLKEKIAGNLPDPFESIPSGNVESSPAPRREQSIDKEGGLAKWWKAVEALRGQEDGRAPGAGMIADWLILTLPFGAPPAGPSFCPWSGKHIRLSEKPLGNHPQDQDDAEGNPLWPLRCKDS